MGGPDISLLTKLAIALDVDIESLLEGNLTHLGLKYKGLLVLDYPEDISADSILYDKPVVFLQLSLFLLSGIREIAIWGNKRNLEFLKNEIADGGRLGVNIVYTQIENTGRTLNSMQNIQYINRILDGSGLFVVSGLDFIYGKDLTKTLRRLFYDSRETITLVSPGGKNLSVSIYPSGVRYTGDPYSTLSGTVL